MPPNLAAIAEQQKAHSAAGSTNPVLQQLSKWRSNNVTLQIPNPPFSYRSDEPRPYSGKDNAKVCQPASPGFAVSTSPKTKAAPNLVANEKLPSLKAAPSLADNATDPSPLIGNVNNKEKENVILERISKKPRRQNEPLVVRHDGKTLIIKEPPPLAPTPTKARRAAASHNQEIVFKEKNDGDIMSVNNPTQTSKRLRRCVDTGRIPFGNLINQQTDASKIDKSNSSYKSIEIPAS